MKDDEKHTLPPLFSAVSNDNKDKANLLIDEEGADVNQVDDHYGLTPLRIAIAMNNKDMVKFLIDKKADVNQPCKDKLTPLQVAKLKLVKLDNHKTTKEYKDYEAIQEILIDHGADVSQLSNDVMKSLIKQFIEDVDSGTKAIYSKDKVNNTYKDNKNNINTESSLIQTIMQNSFLRYTPQHYNRSTSIQQLHEQGFFSQREVEIERNNDLPNAETNPPLSKP